MFTLSDAVLNRLFEVNRFIEPRDELEIFGPRMQFAVLKFQIPRFGMDADGGVVGSLTGAERGIDAWPGISDGAAS